nr:MAG TPA: hypothetical protein [Caudoviricetes sp.]
MVKSNDFHFFALSALILCMAITKIIIQIRYRIVYLKV